jgi:hypothetical protein
MLCRCAAEICLGKHIVEIQARISIFKHVRLYKQKRRANMEPYSYSLRSLFLLTLLIF